MMKHFPRSQSFFCHHDDRIPVKQSQQFPQFDIWSTPLLLGKMFLGPSAHILQPVVDKTLMNPNAPVYTPRNYIHLNFNPVISRAETNENSFLVPKGTIYTPKRNIINSFDPIICPPDLEKYTKQKCKDNIKIRKRLELSPSGFGNGCICGHHQDIRDTFYHSNIIHHGTTIHPKTPAIGLKLQSC